MTGTAVALRAGAERGRIEFGQGMRSGEIIGYLWPSVVALVVLAFLGDRPVPGVAFPLGAAAVPGLLGVNVVLTGMAGLAATLIMERGDGTLLRAKALPNGVLGYLAGKVVAQSALTVAMLVAVLVPAVFLFDGLRLDAPGLLTLVWVLGLGLVATLPVGAVFGALFRSVQAVGLVMLFVMALAAVSGVFYPITALPTWLQWVGQAFPVYWLGLGMRAALLPDALAAAEIGGTWRQVETAVALAGWALLGYLLAPPLLRRLARRT